MKIYRLLIALTFSLAISSVAFAEPIPDTGWGTVLKVPSTEVERVEKGLIEWSNWIKDTHPLDGEENGLENLTITKSYEFENHVIYAVSYTHLTLPTKRIV